MSFRVLVIQEDPSQNGYILQPLLKAVLAAAGKPRAVVELLRNPRTRGYDDAVAAIRGGLIERWRWMDAWIFVPDADRAAADAMQRLERDVARRGIRLLCCPAQPEVEIYACVAYRDELPDWASARCHPRFKEELFAPLLEKHGDRRAAGGGRLQMTLRSVENVELLFRLCPELAKLREQLAGLVERE